MRRSSVTVVLLLAMFASACGESVAEIAAREAAEAEAAAAEAEAQAQADAAEAEEAELAEYRDAVAAAAAGFDVVTGDWPEKTVGLRILAAELGVLQPPKSLVSEHVRVTVLAEEAAAAYEVARDACQLNRTNTLRRALGYAPEPGDDNCWGRGLPAVEMRRQLEAALEELAAAS